MYDVVFFHEHIPAGLVFTVEPGFYFREENLGIRLEDNILVTSTGQLNLMANIPIEVDEIESLMQR